MNTPIPLSSALHVSLILFDQSIAAGFPSPAQDHAGKQVDLNNYLIFNADSTFLFRVRGNSMIGVGIYDGDTVIVDRSITPRHNHIVLGIVDDHFTIKRLYQREQVVRLLPENPDFPPIDFKEGQELRIWGVVTFNLHKLLNSKGEKRIRNIGKHTDSSNKKLIQTE